MIPLPAGRAVADLLNVLLDRKIGVQELKGLRAAPPLQNGILADLRSPDGTVRALLLADLAFVCRSGAALCGVPAPVAEESLREGRIAPTLLDNYREIANIATALFRDMSHRVLLGGIHLAPFPASLQSLVDRPGASKSFELDIAGYGVGRLWLLGGLNQELEAAR
jgi:hypothetical protein